MVGQHTRVYLRDDFLSRMVSMVMLCSLLLATFTFTLTMTAPDTWSAKVWGDPMITTLDGHTYAFNGKGEYVFLNTTDVTIQVRTEYSVANNTDVTGFTAVVVRTVSTTVELYLENTTHISVYVKSSRQRPLLPPVRFPEGMVLQRNGITIINFGTGSLRGSQLQVSASSPKELTIEFTHRGPTSINAHGLAAATTNGSFTMRNGTNVSLNKTEGSIYDFGETWGLFNNESAFNYRLTNKTFHFYNPVNKTRPRFLEELINTLTALFEGQNSSIIQQYNATCRGISECLLVIAMTGQESEGKRFIQDYDDKKRLEMFKSNNPPYFKTTSVSINVTLGETFHMNLSDIVGDDDDFEYLTFSMNKSLTGIEIVTGELRWNVTDLYRNHSVRFELTVTDEFNVTTSQLFPVTYCGCRNVSQCDYTYITDTDSDNQFSRTACRCDETTEGNFCEHVIDPCTKVSCFTNVTCNSSLGFPNPCKTCPPGYTGNGIKCDDIDECRDTHPCSQQCSNSIGSYSCSCNSGYKLSTDGKNCTDINAVSTCASATQTFNGTHPTLTGSGDGNDRESMGKVTLASFCPVGSVSVTCRDEKGEDFAHTGKYTGSCTKETGLICNKTASSTDPCPDFSITYTCSCPPSTTPVTSGRTVVHEKHTTERHSGTGNGNGNGGSEVKGQLALLGVSCVISFMTSLVVSLPSSLYGF